MKIKLGFSLAELLLCIAIIGIVSVMGIILMNHNIDRANNLFYYTGYINLYSALAEEHIENSDFNFTKEDIMPALNDYLGTVDFDEYEADDPIIAPNGIRYIWNNGKIDMQVPQRKTRSNPEGIGIVTLCYIRDNGGFLIPLQGGSVDLQNRKDLLPTYIDNGVVGRALRGHHGAWEMKPRPVYSYKEAFCSLNNNQTFPDVIDCDGGEGNQQGALKILDPRKI